MIVPLPKEAAMPRTTDDKRKAHEEGRARVIALARATRLSTLSTEQRRVNAYRAAS
jgi:hypothetical protein